MDYNIQVFNIQIAGDGIVYERNVILALHNTTVIGHIDLDIYTNDYATITWVYVEPKYRGIGIASAMLDRAWEITTENNVDYLGLIINKSNEQNKLRDFYIKHGYTVGEFNENGGLGMWKCERNSNEI